MDRPSSSSSRPSRPPKRPLVVLDDLDLDTSSTSSPITATTPSESSASSSSTPGPLPTSGSAPAATPSSSAPIPPPTITILPLGAGQDVGRSCILVTFSTTGRTVMLDCGMHMGFHDARMFPDFSYLTRSTSLSAAVDAVLISHFHLDHCGALPYMCKTFEYDGPVVMSAPTKAVCPILLEDFAKIQAGRRGRGASATKEDASAGKKDPLMFGQEDIVSCLAKVTTIDVHQTIRLKHDLEVQAFYAGHVLGAVMFLVRSGPQSILYTGDYNMTPDRHLGAAWLPPTLHPSPPDVLITESTYATTIRDSRRTRERDFLRKVHDTLQAGGKVLLPVFAVGRAQELAILLESYAERMHWSWPMYFVGGLTRKSMAYYRLFVHWTNQTLRAGVLANPGHALGGEAAAATDPAGAAAANPGARGGGRNPFDFKRIQTLAGGNNAELWSALEAKGGMVVFASPGMLHSGLSLEIFKRWCADKRNVVILPGYCVPGTVGAQLLAGPSEGVRTIKVPVEEEGGKSAKGGGSGGAKGSGPPATRDVRCEMRVENLAFSAHADGKGILQLIRTAKPRAVVLVHGERGKMAQLVKVVHESLATPCHMPANHQPLVVPTPWVDSDIDVHVAGSVRRDVWEKMNLRMGKRAVSEAVASATYGPTYPGVGGRSSGGAAGTVDGNARAVGGRDVGWARVPVTVCHVDLGPLGAKDEARILYPAQVMQPVAGAIPPMAGQPRVTLVGVKCSIALPVAVKQIVDPAALAAFINAYSASAHVPVFARAEDNHSVKVVSAGQELMVDCAKPKLVWRPLMPRGQGSSQEYIKVRRLLVAAVTKYCG
ncbi:beta-lactamase-like protein [Catenaria anguillulae PL171]|uniref:Beta-lactamase-like protein n=1 Tax=Catenaria anguillulae PL171 TaxID=765915 RepID=A0A1Y2H5M4_9FUNG|nr:beta-lactamase-like protein [Catenaria anguillulae PL171]